MKKLTKYEKLEEHRKRNCLFCNLQKQLGGREKYRTLNVRHPEVCFALLDKSPKILGHSLVIARTPFDDLTDTLSDVDESEKTKMFKVTIELARKLKSVLKAEKVYVMSMCEHWEMWESSNGLTAEHFHFHLVPRYYGMRNKWQAAENLLAREGKEQKKDDLEKIANLLNHSKESKESFNSN